MFYVVLLLLIIIILLIMKITIIAEASPVEIQVRIVIFKLIKIRIVDKTKQENGRLEPTKLNKNVSLRIINIRSMIKALKEPIKKLLSKLQINLKFKLVYGLSSPDKTAISYGILNGIIYSFDLAIDSMVKKYNGTYTINPDMKKPTFNYDIEAKVSFRTLTLMPSIFKLLKIAFIQIRRDNRKEGMKNGRASHRKLNENYNGQP